jgi:signal transduction histidine kinase
MLDATARFKPHTVFGQPKMTAPRAIWLGLAILAAIGSSLLGVPIWLSLAALGCAVVPPIMGSFVGSSTTPERLAELETVFWIALATLGAAATGGAGSPLIVLYFAAVGTAWSAGHVRLTAEAVVFSLLGLAAAILASSAGPWLEPRHASGLGMAYGVSGLALVGAIAALSVRQPAGAKGPESPKPVAGANGSTDPALRLRQVEARMRQAEAAERAARGEVEAANARLEARTTFFAQTSHELRTPLNAIVGFAEMMRNAVFGPLPERYQEYAGLIHEGGRNLSLIVDDVLDLARVEAGRYEIHRDIISLTDLAADAVHFMEDEAARKGVVLELANGGDIEAFADSKAVRQIALNLISNALKFTPHGGNVTVAAMDAPGGSLLVVSDTGAGISPEELTRLSRAFEQGEAGRRQKGAGLGLSVVRAFAELHGGRLDIESREGGGSTIAVFFPAEAGGA